MEPDYYRILQVDPAAEPEVIEAAYRRLCRKYHPDLNPSPEAERRMREINAAYAVLRDPVQRAAYDARRTRRPGQPRLEVCPVRLDLGPVPVGAPVQAALAVWNADDSPLRGTVHWLADWLHVSPTRFAANRLRLTVTADTRTLAPGVVYQTTVTIATNGGAVTVPVLLQTDARGPVLEVQPESLDLGTLGPGQRARQTLRLRNTGQGLLRGTVFPRGDWLQVQPTEFVGNEVALTVIADPQVLHGFWTSPGPASVSLEGGLIIRSNGGEQRIRVLLRLTHRRRSWLTGWLTGSR